MTNRINNIPNNSDFYTKIKTTFPGQELKRTANDFLILVIQHGGADSLQKMLSTFSQVGETSSNFNFLKPEEETKLTHLLKEFKTQIEDRSLNLSIIESELGYLLTHGLNTKCSIIARLTEIEYSSNLDGETVDKIKLLSSKIIESLLHKSDLDLHQLHFSLKQCSSDIHPLTFLEKIKP